ncbi:(2Fe-2S)-binding protein [Nocardioides soli]|uniref:Aerobic-type carbon monoxide dehydrogenase small subunit (CoxS/CutS family) n=1 Tax=Nocardioides soli TaxID=1036020 RepID=A0A7W4W0Q0_9ACTN|nr:aerobic-type carbon monoxide dehydrogenase small subunit (CoxS/CutS family) [Nocardioides soli]
MRVEINLNGKPFAADVEPRMLLSDFIRHEACLTGTHVGCEQGGCGACTIQVDGRAVRSCLLFAIQVDGSTVRTVEALSDERDGALHPLQEAFRECHGLQCGFCTPGFLMSLEPALASGPLDDEQAIRDAISGNICRCTGYAGIVDAVRHASNTIWNDPDIGTVDDLGSLGEDAPRSGAGDE